MVESGVALPRPLLLVLAGLVCVWFAACGSAPDPPHGVILLGLDTLRADGLSSYGNPRPASPTLDALAADGVRFENAISNASWTLPGFAGILTGHYYTAHIMRRSRLVSSLVERFRLGGYRTAAFTEGGYVSSAFGFELGFDDFWEERGRIVAAPGADSGAARTFAKAVEWLGDHGSEPFLLFVHTYEPHVPYVRRNFAEDLPRGALGETYPLTDNLRVIAGKIPVGDAERAYVRALYDGGVAETDAQVRILLAKLEALDIADRTLVAVVSDHGEELGEHRPQDLGLHGHALWQTLLRVPMIVYDPRTRFARQRIKARVSTLDLMPTLLELAGLPAEPGTAGRSLVPLMRGEEAQKHLPVFSQLRAQETGELLEVAVQAGRFKLVRRLPRKEDPGSLRLYALDLDPGEQIDRAEELPKVRTRLHARLQQHVAALERAGSPGPSAPSADPMLRDRLRALGYLDP